MTNVPRAGQAYGLQEFVKRLERGEIKPDKRDGIVIERPVDSHHLDGVLLDKPLVPFRLHRLEDQEDEVVAAEERGAGRVGGRGDSANPGGTEWRDGAELAPRVQFFVPADGDNGEASSAARNARVGLDQK